jgi:toxin CptA
MKSAALLAVSIKPSRRLLGIQSIAHVAAVGAVLASRLPAWLMAGFLLLIGASLAHFRRALPITGLVLHGDGRIEIVGADGVASDAAVHPHTLVLSFLIVLLYRQQGRLRSLTLLGDSLSDEDFRQLRLWLRWRSAATGPA